LAEAQAAIMAEIRRCIKYCTKKYLREAQDRWLRSPWTPSGK
jgi:hypothetical protein